MAQVVLYVDDCVECCVCHGAYGDNINAVVSGVSICACTTTGAETGGLDASIEILSGAVNGSFDLVWDPGLQGWKLDAIAVVKFTIYDSTDQSCSGSVVAETEVEADIQAGCDPLAGATYGQFAVLIRFFVVITTPFSYAHNWAFFTSDYDTFGDAMPNLLTSCGVELVAGEDGTATLATS